MASGVPVITSDCTSLPEVVGEAGVLLPADNAQRWTQAIIELIEDPKIYQQYVDKGLHRATQFGWTTSAKKTLSCFKAIAGLYA